MSMLSPFVSVDSSCDQALQRVSAQLSQAGLTVVQTFNLSTARLGSHICPCPHHGTDACDCQMIVLLVYGRTPEPATLILHGNDGKTRVSIADNTLQTVDSALITTIQNALIVPASTQSITK